MSLPHPSITPEELRSLHHALVDGVGVVLITTLMYCVLHGITCLQTYIYYSRQTQDPFWMRILPGCLISIQTVTSTLLCVGVYNAVVINFGNLERDLTVSPPELVLQGMFQAWLIIGSQFFFTYRIWKFGKSKPAISVYIWIFPFICVPLAIVQLVLLSVGNALILAHGSLLQYLSSDPLWKKMSYALTVINLFLDSIFASAMVWLLQHEGKSPFSRTNNMINRLKILTINAGVLTVTVAIVTFILRAVFPTNFLYAAWWYLLGPLYTNSVLANLNVRDYLRGDNTYIEQGEVSTRIEFALAKSQLSSTEHSLPIVNEATNAVVKDYREGT